MRRKSAASGKARSIIGKSADSPSLAAADLSSEPPRWVHSPYCGDWHLRGRQV